MRRMPVLSANQERTENTLRQVLDLLEELSVTDTDDEEDETVAEQDEEMVAQLAEEASERGMDEEQAKRVLKQILHMVRTARQ
ncbi:hypothetical protein HZA45_01815 [Candidatus Peregrinibacteria bacterium]|nr:hypothetical protein [Candidatus Peregrinibacteria bacterium]